MRKLAIVTTHPIQYNAPVFKLMHEREKVAIHVFYTWSQAETGTKYDPGFKKNISWDIPLLEGYPYSFVKNVAVDDGTHHFKGIDNRTLVSEVEAYKPDAIMVYSWCYKSHLRLLRHFHGRVPILFRGDSTLLDEQPGWRKVARRIALTWVYSHVDIALFVGDNNKEYYKKHGKKEKSLRFVPHAIDNSRFNALNNNYQSEAQQWRTALGIGEQDVVFLCAGKLEDKKDPALLLEAFSALPPTNMHLLLVGNGEKEEQLKSVFGSKANIHFIDFQNQSRMPVVYQMADVFVLPSKGPEETWGLALNEAMASGRAVLASDKCGGAINLVREGENGYIFKNRNLEDLKTKMQMFLERKHQLKQMGRHSLEIVKDYSFEAVCERVEQIVEQL